MTNDSWIRNTFTIEHKFREEKSIFGNVRGTVHEYSEYFFFFFFFLSRIIFPFYTNKPKTLIPSSRRILNKFI